MTAAAAVLELEGIARRFGGRAVLEDASLRLEAGRTTALMGRNGAGKSTLLRIAVGRDRPDVGRISWRGRTLARPSLAELALDGLLYCAQGGALTRLFTLRQHLEAMAASFGGQERVGAAVEALGLGPPLDRRPTRVSEGERRRAVLALALVRQPLCLLMDEPLAGVEPKDRPRIAAGLRSLAEAGTAILLSGHDAEDVLAVADEVVWLWQGTTRRLGPPAEARADPDFRREYLGTG